MQSPRSPNRPRSPGSKHLALARALVPASGAGGARRSMTLPGGGAWTYEYSDLDVLLTRGASNYTNDANGNTLTGGNRTNVWNSQNRLTSCTFNGTASAFTYSADGLRRSMTTGGAETHYAYDNTMMVREFNDGQGGVGLGSVKATYLPGPRGVEYRRDDGTGTVRWYVYDGLGSVMAEVAPDGTLTRTQSFDVYGAVRSSAGTDTTKHTYVGSLGHLSDDATGLIYMRARYYDPVTGRFASEDPARDAGNWYAYCDGDPVNRWDRNGREWEDVPGTRWQYDIHVDNAPNTEHVVLRDERGRLVGSYYLHPQTRTWNHPPKWHIPERVRRGLRGAGIGIPACSVIAYLEQDPLGFLAIVFNIAGEHDKAADLDRMNGTL